MARPTKTLRLNFVKEDADLGAYIQVLGRPSEVKLSAGPKSFVSVRDDGITLSPGPGYNINIQGLSQNMRYGGLLMDLPFPLSILPTTPFTPFPKQVFMPPLARILPFIVDLSAIASSLVA